MRHRFEHLHEQGDALLDAQAMAVGMALDGLALDQLEHQVGLTVPRDAGIEHSRDVAVGEPREDRALWRQARLAAQQRAAGAALPRL